MTDADLAKYMAVDVETTGLDPAVDRIKSIGAVVGNRRTGILHKMRTMVDAEGQPSAPDALRIHRIPDIVEGAMTPRRALQLLEGVRDGALVLMHHKAYDGPMLKMAYTRAGLTIPSYLLDLDTVEDTMEIGKKFYPGKPTGLSSLVRAAGLLPDLLKGRNDQHDSLEDATMCFELWRRHAGGTSLDLVAPPEQAAATKRPNGGAAAIGLNWMS